MSVYRSKDSPRVSLGEHINAVAAAAYRYGQDIGAPNTAAACGLLYSFGRFSDLKKYASGMFRRIDFCAPGAAYLYAFYDGKRKTLPENVKAAIETICACYTSLRSFDSLEPFINEILDGTSPRLVTRAGGYVSASGAELYQASRAFSEVLPTAPARLRQLRTESVNHLTETDFERMLFGRMLYSCLIDAQRSLSNTENENEFLVPELIFDSELDVRDTYNKLRPLLSNSNTFFSACKEEGRGDAQLVSIAAPASQERTLASILFAVSKCENHDKHKRIIAVLPSLELVPETEKLYRRIFPDVLIACGQYEKDEDVHALQRSWDAPCIITTAKIFFESLMSGNRADCQKLHRIANSVVVLEDLQALHTKMLSTSIDCINTLSSKYGTCFAVVSSSNPDFGAITDREWAPTVLRKKTQAGPAPSVLWSHEEAVSLWEVAEKSVEAHQVCVIVNKKEHAREIFSHWENSTHNGDVFLLSSDMCPAHIRDTAKIIKTKLASGQACKVITSPVIEQGQWTFPIVYREMAPMPSILLASDMCKRSTEGGSELHVFSLTGTPEHRDLFPNTEYANATLLTRELLAKHDDLWYPQIYPDISVFYKRPFIGRDTDPLVNTWLEGFIRDHDYVGVKKAFTFTPKQGAFKIIVPYSEKYPIYEDLQQAMSKDTVTREMLRKAEDITLTAYAEQKDIEEVCIPIYLENPYTRKRFFSGVYLLKREFMGKGYKLFAGLSFPWLKEAVIPDNISNFKQKE